MQWLDKSGLAEVISKMKSYTRSLLEIGSVGHPGMLAPDGTSITVDENGTISSVFEGGVEPTVDNALSLTSENPVQNQVITACINDMNDSLDIVKAHAKATGNVHNLTLSDLGIANVENKSSSDIRGEITKENVVDALGYEPNDSGQSPEHTCECNIRYNKYTDYIQIYDVHTDKWIDFMKSNLITPQLDAGLYDESYNMLISWDDLMAGIAEEYGEWNMETSSSGDKISKYLNKHSVGGCLVIPGTVTKINSYVLEECSSLTRIIIPDSVTSIGGYAFRSCSR